MSKRVLILVEGQTEERFAKDVLAPYFVPQQLHCTATILVTKHVKDGPRFKGGVTNFAKFENDVNRLLNSSGGALVTTMLDYYRLPTDFPGMDDRPIAGASSREKVLHVERAIHEYFGCPRNFRPFLALHEFEAWLFSSPEVLPGVLTARHKKNQFARIINQVETPEDINERPEWAPSKRIEKLFPGYRKTLHGPLAAKRIGLDAIRAACPHFDTWMGHLEAYAAK